MTAQIAVGRIFVFGVLSTGPVLPPVYRGFLDLFHVFAERVSDIEVFLFFLERASRDLRVRYMSGSRMTSACFLVTIQFKYHSMFSLVHC